MMKIIPRPTKQTSNKYYESIYEYFAAEKRIVFLYSAIIGFPIRQDPFASWIVADTLMALDTLSSDPIILVIDSPGGELDACFALYDTIKMLRSPIVTFGRVCCSAAVAILAAGNQGHRYLLPNSRVMLHLIQAGVEGDPKTIRKQQKEIDRMEDKYIQILLNNGVRKDKTQILKDIDREFWLNPQEAIDYGVADCVLTKDWMKSLGIK